VELDDADVDACPVLVADWLTVDEQAVNATATITPMSAAPRRNRWELGTRTVGELSDLAVVSSVIARATRVRRYSERLPFVLGSLGLGGARHPLPGLVCDGWGTRRVTVALKNGFEVIDGWQINTTGWVSVDGRDYLIAVLTNGNVSEQYGGIDTVNALSALVWNAFGT
jgi:hypothetical protein